MSINAKFVRSNEMEFPTAHEKPQIATPKITKLRDSVKYFCLLCDCICTIHCVHSISRYKEKCKQKQKHTKKNNAKYTPIDKTKQKLYFAIKPAYMFVYTYFSISIACSNEIQYVTIDTKWTTAIKHAEKIAKACWKKNHEKKMVRNLNGRKKNPFLFAKSKRKKLPTNIFSI